MDNAERLCSVFSLCQELKLAGISEAVLPSENAYLMKPTLFIGEDYF